MATMDYKETATLGHHGLSGDGYSWSSPGDESHSQSMLIRIKTMIRTKTMIRIKTMIRTKTVIIIKV